MPINLGTILGVVVIGWAVYAFIRDLLDGKWW